MEVCGGDGVLLGFKPKSKDKDVFCRVFGVWEIGGKWGYKYVVVVKWNQNERINQSRV